MDSETAFEGSFEFDVDPLVEPNYTNLKSAILFCVEVSKSMLMELERGPHDSEEDAPPTPLRRALAAAYNILQERIISDPSDAIGIMLFGTEYSDDARYPGISMLMDLDVPDIAGMKRLKDVLEYDEDFLDLAKPASEPPSIRDVLFYAGHKFYSKNEKFAYRRMFLMTNTDLPPAHSPQDRIAARTRASDLLETGIQIEPFFLSSPPKLIFDSSKFYEDILFLMPLKSRLGGDQSSLKRPRAEVSEASMQPLLTTDRLILESQLKSRQAPQRALFSIPMEIVEGKRLVINVKGYALFRRQSVLRTEFVYKCDDDVTRIARSKRKPVGEDFFSDDEDEKNKKKKADDATVTKPSSVKRGFLFGGEIISFTDEELTQLREFGEIGIKIIGFKSANLLPINMTSRPSYFLYPSEEDYVGSIRTFAALHKIMLEQNQMAVAWARLTANSSPMLCNIVAADEIVATVNGRREQVQAPGMHVIRMPFVDDVRDKPYNARYYPSSSVTTAIASEIINKLTLKSGYDPSRYKNPILQRHYRILQAKALEEPFGEEEEAEMAKEDKTVPMYNSIHNKVGRLSKEWKRLVEEEMDRRELED
ncbi:SPOC like C-terminal domain-containing protein [Myxozyma melibiosi]|uniref:ATP-dependent DNA helicase II subunit 1 n=1 Tax=Myxozyma melibiosi TaxID=54550 RepID=A0ABR1FBS7_9ASCO